MLPIPSLRTHLQRLQETVNPKGTLNTNTLRYDVATLLKKVELDVILGFVLLRMHLKNLAYV